MAAVHADLVVVGGGPAGYTGAIRAAQLGLKVVCIDKRGVFGGTCLNVGCIPSKALLESSELYYMAQKKLSDHGVVASDVKLNLSIMQRRKEQVVQKLVLGVESLLKKNKIQGLLGSAVCHDLKSQQKTIEVQTDNGLVVVQATKVLLAPGSESASLPQIPFNGHNIVNSTDALDFDAVPPRMLVIGAGAIGLEMGSVWSRLGSKVVIVEVAPQICSSMDKAASMELQKQLQKQGLQFYLSTQVLSAVSQGELVSVEMQDKTTQKKVSLEVEKVLIAVGRRPYTGSLGLKECSVAMDERGFILVDHDYKTNLDNVFAVGDAITGPMLAHKASDEAVVAVERMVGQKSEVFYDGIPNVVYTWPELASVGKTEEQLKAASVAYKVGTFPFLANGRARTMNEAEGFVKVLADAKTDRILGVHIVGPRASDMIAEAAAVMEFSGSSEDLARICHAHPTLAESLKEAALAVEKRTINI
jgi:dihydrolipoamide dehydrogenase